MSERVHAHVAEFAFFVEGEPLVALVACCGVRALEAVPGAVVALLGALVEEGRGNAFGASGSIGALGTI